MSDTLLTRFPYACLINYWLSMQHTFLYLGLLFCFALIRIFSLKDEGSMGMWAVQLSLSEPSFHRTVLI